jgi:protein gp37
MSENSKIERTDHTFNPWEGCQKVGPGFDHCYAETRNARFGGGTVINWGPGAPRRRTSAANWRKPIQWNAQHDAFFAAHGRRQRVFCASLADVFDNAVDPSWRVDLFRLIRSTPNLDWLLLIKCIGNARQMIDDARDADALGPVWPWDNVCLGATIVNQEEADRDIPKLLEVPARVRFLSMEPVLGPVDLESVAWPSIPGQRADVLRGGYWNKAGVLACGQPAGLGEQRGGFTNHSDMPGRIDRVIAGGESGGDARPMHPDWVRDLRDQCDGAGRPLPVQAMGKSGRPAKIAADR